MSPAGVGALRTRLRLMRGNGSLCTFRADPNPQGRTLPSGVPRPASALSRSSPKADGPLTAKTAHSAKRPCRSFSVRALDSESGRALLIATAHIANRRDWSAGGGGSEAHLLTGTAKNPGPSMAWRPPSRLAHPAYGRGRGNRKRIQQPSLQGGSRSHRGSELPVPRGISSTTSLPVVEAWS